MSQEATRSSQLNYSQAEYHLLNLDDNRIHSPYEMEAQSWEYIRQGNAKAAVDYIQQHMGNPEQDLGTYANSEQKQLEYTCVTAVALTCRIAIGEGVVPAVSYNLSDYYLQMLSEITDPSKYMGLLTTAIYDYCSLINEARAHKAEALPVQRCKRYIYDHLTDPLTLQDVASALSLSPSYLSSLFHKETGMTFKQYLLEERIKQAKDMLRYSDYPISEISDRLCFCSQSHFTQNFKRLTGLTPSEYRRQ